MFTAYLDAMRHYADFGGRATRAQYWWYVLTVSLMGSAMLIVDLAAFGEPDNPKMPLFLLFHLAHVMPGFALGVRRLHDLGRSGWLMLLALIPFVGPVLLVVWFCQPGTPGPNRFGARPSGIAPSDAMVSKGTTPLASGMRDVVGEIERLAQLRACGTLSDAEFQVLKAQALARQVPPSAAAA